MAQKKKNNRSRRYRPYRERYVSPKTKWTIALSILGALLIAALVLAFLQGWIKLPERPEVPVETTVATEPPEDTVIHFVAGGDVNVTDRVIAAGGREYDYSTMLMDVLPTLSNGDLTVVNFEGNVCGEPYGSSLHSAPQQLLTALCNAGVDVLQTANSQAITNGLRGLAATNTAIRNAKMQPLGTYASKEEFDKYNGYLLYEINGIRVALVSFTKGMDGRNLPEGNENSVNLLYKDYGSTYREINTEGITRILNAVADAQPDITIAMLHWGSEYNDTVNPTQQKICQLMQSLGVDAIIGSHPHYVQKMGFDAETGLFVAYSLGDLCGDADINGTDYSVLLDLEITKNGATGETTITGFDYTPLYLYHDPVEGLRVLRINEAIAAYENHNINRVSDEVYAAMVSALARIQARVNAT